MEMLQTYEHGGAVLQLASYEPEAPRPVRAVSLRAPGAGNFEVTELELAEGEEGLTLTAQVSGRNIAYIYTELLLKDKSLERFYGPVAREHLQADRNSETGGLSRPVWDDPIDVRVRLRRSLRLLSDGVGSAFCFSAPERYGSLDYRLSGLYTPVGGAASLRVVLVFGGDGEIKRISAYEGQGRRFAPRALSPKQGDRFAPFVQVLTPPVADGDWGVATAVSNLLTFGDQPLRVVTGPSVPGHYLAGLLIQDLDGGLVRKYVPLAISK
jgi:hypothetical protein